MLSVQKISSRLRGWQLCRIPMISKIVFIEFSDLLDEGFGYFRNKLWRSMVEAVVDDLIGIGMEEKRSILVGSPRRI
jgi:hypothetical protein